MGTRTTIALGILALTTVLTGCKKAGPNMMARSPMGAMAGEDWGGDMFRERYAHNADNAFVAVADQAVSTFSVDVDTGSYSNTRRFLEDGILPPVDAVRIEELVNYFDYAYPQPRGDVPFSATTEVGECPWNAEHQLVHIGIQGKRVEAGQVPPRNLVYLVDVSGSMEDADKLPLLKRGLIRMADTLRENDTVALVVYAGASGEVLRPPNDKQQIRRALASLEAGGSTNGASGIELAYDLAELHLCKGGINRVILATDGDFNVGPSSDGELIRLIEDKRETGIYLSVLGFGTGNYNESAMEQIADHGNGNYAYIDSDREAKRVLSDQANATLVPIADDVKLQVEFNPAHVEAYRLIGYENRVLDNADFNDDAKDAGEIGAGHTVTALYEIVPAGAGEFAPEIDELKYQDEATTKGDAPAGGMMNVKIRYKDPGADDSKLLSFEVGTQPTSQTSDAFRFSAAVASFGMLLRNSPDKGSASFEKTLRLAKGAVGSDPDGTRHEFVSLVRRAAKLEGQG